MMYEFKTAICLCDLNDAEVQADFSADDCGNVHLDSVTIGKLVLSQQQVADMIGDAELSRQIALVRDWWLEDGLHDARIDARAAWAEAAE